jgi:hypothetical protein
MPQWRMSDLEDAHTLTLTHTKDATHGAGGGVQGALVGALVLWSASSACLPRLVRPLRL